MSRIPLDHKRTRWFGLLRSIANAAMARCWTLALLCCTTASAHGHDHPRKPGGTLGRSRRAWTPDFGSHSSVASTRTNCGGSAKSEWAAITYAVAMTETP